MICLRDTKAKCGQFVEFEKLYRPRNISSLDSFGDVSNVMVLKTSEPFPNGIRANFIVSISYAPDRATGQGAREW